MIYCSIFCLGPPENGQATAPRRFKNTRQIISVVFTGPNPSDLLLSPLSSTIGQSWRTHFQSKSSHRTVFSMKLPFLVVSRKSRSCLSIQLCVRDFASFRDRICSSNSLSGSMSIPVRLKNECYWRVYTKWQISIANVARHCSAGNM